MLPLRNPAVIYQPVADGAVLFSPAEEVYFGLNAAGAKVWEALPPASESWDELCATLRDAYPATPPETLREDATELISLLLAQRLVLPGGGGDAA